MKFILVFFLLLSFDISAIVIRHDVEPEKYDANWEDFPPLAQFYIDGAHGSLIAPTWVVTAAHTTFCTNPGTTILIGGKNAIVKKRYIHPEHAPGISHDIALLELQTPVTDIAPAKMYLNEDEAGQVVTLIGAGGTGTGIDGQTIDNFENNGKLRKATNTVDIAYGPLMQFVFNEGKEATLLEGISGGGDSGGPAFIKNGNHFFVLGVSSRGELGSVIGKYGNTEYYSRISYFKQWISDIIKGSEAEREAISLPELKHLMSGLTEENLPEICADIQILPN